MSNDKNKAAKKIEREDSTEQVVTKVRLHGLLMLPERFCHRPEEDLEEKQLGGLLDSIQREGLQVPIEYYRDGEGRKVLVKGHRRVSACRILARKGAKGFAPDMEVDAVEVRGADEQTLLVRSILDNAQRKSLDQVSRIRAARALYLARVPEERAAEALGISTQSYKRDLLIAEHPWMLAHVQADEVGATAAYLILDKAVEKKRVEQVREDLAEWVAAKRAEIQQKERLLKLKSGKKLPEAQRQVKRHLDGKLVKHWLDLIEAGQPLDERAGWTYLAIVNREKDELQLASVNLNLAKAPVRTLVEVATKLSQVAKELGPILRERYEEEKNRARSDDGKSVVRDLDYLKQHGLEDLAEEFEQELAVADEAGPEAQEDPELTRHPARAEQDLAAEVEDEDGPDGDTAGPDPGTDSPAKRESAR